ncbi:MAG: ABC transporter substrate-binding protein [Lachnospiraceae bacterium]|nr:ABC transporter substrate-binding protein [Lachnospiraceae bacterium]
MKRKVLAMVLAGVMVLGMTGCGSADTNTNVEADAATQETEQQADTTEAATESGDIAAASEASGTVVVYSPHDADPLNAGVNMFMEAYPNIQVEVVAAGTGELCNRVAAETENPIADVFWGGGADSLEAFKEYFAPYVCANDDVIDEAYKSSEDLWIGESPLPMVIFYNKELLEKDGMEAPTSWEDLTDPKWSGKIAYCLPSKSGSAYTQLCTMILAHGGKEDGWDFIKKLYANLDGKLVDSSGKCHKMVKDGEFYVGLTLEKSAVQYDGDDTVGYCYPTDGTSAVPDGIALIKNAPNEENAKLFIDFITSKECQEAEAKDWGRRPVRNDLTIEGLPALSELNIVDYDFNWAAAEKEANIEKFNDIMVN